MNAIGFVERSILAAFLILIITVIRFMMKRRLHRKVFVILWVIVVFRLILPFSLQFPLPFSSGIEFAQEICNHLSEQYSYSDSDKEPALDGQEVISQDNTAYRVDSIHNMDGHNTGIDKKNLAELPGNGKFFHSSYARLMVTGLWFAGTVIFASFFTVSYLRSSRKIKEALPIVPDTCDFRPELLTRGRHKVKLMVSDQLNTPVACGIWKPKIVFPRFLEISDKESMAYIMEHELCHLRRLDQVWKLMTAAALCLHWFNPFVWLMFLFIQQDLEISCDEEVIARLGDTAKKSYAMTLVHFAEQRSGFSILYSSFGKNIAQERIMAIMKYKKSNMCGIILAVVLIYSSLTVFAAGTNTDNQASVFKENAVTLKLGRAMLQQLLYYEPFGLSLDKDNGYLIYDNTPVRELYDENKGVLIAFSVKDTIPENHIDIRAVYDGDNLTSLSLATQEEYDARTKERDKYSQYSTTSEIIFFYKSEESNTLSGLSTDSDLPYVIVRTKLPKEYIDTGFSFNPDTQKLYYKEKIVSFIHDDGHNYRLGNTFMDNPLQLQIIRDDSGEISEIKEIPADELNSKN